MIGYNEKVGQPIDFSQWLYIGELLDELSSSIISSSKELEESELKEISKFYKK